jgi:hypothetical protein
MNTKDDTIKLRRRLLILLLIVAPLGLVILISIVTGYFAPLQTSRVTAFGVCTQEGSYAPISALTTNIETLYICGILEGNTKRYLTFSMFYGDQYVSGTSQNLSPGVFFIPVEATGLQFIRVSSFPKGDYRLDYSYARDPFETVIFTVNGE